MDGKQAVINPFFVPWAPGLSLHPIVISMCSVPSKAIVSITGGCAGANIGPGVSSSVVTLFTEAFTGFSGVIVIGGTRMILNKDPEQVLFGITEIGPAIRQNCPDSMVLGVIPRLEGVAHNKQNETLEVSQSTGQIGIPNHTTIVHPNQDMVVGVCQRLLPQQEIWDDEVEFRRFVTQELLTFSRGQWSSVLIAYNGGSVTEREIRATAQRGWPVILIRGSGRITDMLAADTAFLEAHPTVHVCEHSAASLRALLHQLHIVDDSASGADRPSSA